ncbi:MAG: hypothetical protein MJ188_02120 [Treponema sp.]|nr:hypothetical protein [Treponema sp.]
MKKITKKMNKNIKIFLLVIFSTILIGTLIYFSSTFFSFFACYKAVQKLPEIKMEEYMRIKLYGNTSNQNENTVSATFTIVNTNGNEIASIERSWTGIYLQVDFVQVSMQNKSYFFPSVIYGKNRIYENLHSQKKMTNLSKYFNDNNQCFLLGVGATSTERKYLYWISQFALKRNPIFGFKYKKSISLDLSDCQRGRYYSIVCDEKGKLIVQEM